MRQKVIILEGLAAGSRQAVAGLSNDQHDQHQEDQHPDPAELREEQADEEECAKCRADEQRLLRHRPARAKTGPPSALGRLSSSMGRSLPLRGVRTKAGVFFGLGP